MTTGLPEFEQLPTDWRRLVLAARSVRQNAYAIYSGFAVGASLLTADGQIVVGCNVENASYGLTICAERAAMCSAVSAGHTDIVAACVSLTGDPVPCGTCRQFLYEFNPQMLILLDNPESAPADGSRLKPPESVLLKDLLPRAFFLQRDDNRTR